MTTKNLFIVFEGIDYSGKTFCAKILAERLEGWYYKNPPEECSEIRKEIDATGDLISRYCFYSSMNLVSSDKARELLAERPVIMDRYFFSTLAYHRAMGLNVTKGTLPFFPKLLLPDFTFCLYASKEVIAERRAKRGIGSANDQLMADNDLLSNKVLEEYKKLNLIEIDTSNLTPEEVVDKILEIIKRGT